MAPTSHQSQGAVRPSLWLFAGLFFIALAGLSGLVGGPQYLLPGAVLVAVLGGVVAPLTYSWASRILTERRVTQREDEGPSSGGDMVERRAQDRADPGVGELVAPAHNTGASRPEGTRTPAELGAKSDGVMTAEEAAELLRVDVYSLLREIRAGTFPGNEVGGQARVSRQAVDLWLNGAWRSGSVGGATDRSSGGVTSGGDAT